MATFNYTPEMLQWIHDHAFWHWDVVAAHFNQHFGCNQTPIAIAAVAKRNGIRNTAPVYNKFYSDKMMHWLRLNAPGTPWKVIANRFNTEFNTNKTLQEIKAACKRAKICNGISRLTYNAYADGAVRHGQTQNQIKINGRWRSNAVHVYERTHGVKLDLRKYRIIHLDRNMYNDAPDNLYAFPIKNLCALSGYYRSGTVLTKEMLDSFNTIAAIQHTKTKKINEIFGSRNAEVRARYHSDPTFRERMLSYSRKSKRKQREKLKQQGKPIK